MNTSQNRNLIAITLALASTTCFAEDYYYSCSGKTGMAEHQETLSLLNKAITYDEDTVDGSIHMTAESVIVDGIPFVDGTYKVCQNSDQYLWFSPSGSKYYCAGNDLFHHIGVFNKATGNLSYHAGYFLAILQCKESKKKKSAISR